jgi:hypothetical protein
LGTAVNDSRSIDELLKFIGTENKKKKKKKVKKGNARDSSSHSTEHVITPVTDEPVPGLGNYPRFWEEDHEARDPEIDRLVEEFRQRLAGHQSHAEPHEDAPKLKIEPRAFERLADICRNNSRNRFPSPGDRAAPIYQGTHRSKRKKRK